MGVTTNNMYKFRNYLGELYTGKNNTIQKNDLIELIYTAIDDKREKIKAFNCSLSNKLVSVTLKEDHLQDDLTFITKNISSAIETFIKNNAVYINIPEEEKEEFKCFIYNGSNLFECYTIGNTINFAL